EKMFEEALEFLEQALSRDPGLTSAYEAVASIYEKWNEPLPTANHFDSLARQNPGVPWYTGMAARLYQAVDVVPSAMARYEELLRAVPDYADAHYQLALLYERVSQAAEPGDSARI